MDNVIESVQAALAGDATPEIRAAGVTACRAILVALEGTSREPMAAAVPEAPTQIANIVSALRGVPPEHLLDLAIAKLRAALPDSAQVPAATPLKFHIVPVTRRA